jgi:hypothetical protein
MEQIPGGRRNDRDPVDAGVPVKTLVLGAKDRRDQRRGDIRKGNPRKNPALEIRPHFLERNAVAVEQNPLGWAMGLPDRAERREGTPHREEQL